VLSSLAGGAPLLTFRPLQCPPAPPGVSRFVSDRDFLLRVVRVNFPHGLHVLACHSLPPDEVVPGDPGPSLPHTIRCVLLGGDSSRD
jgi:hypothetical protein